MPRLVRTIDVIAAERGSPVLFLRFGDIETFNSNRLKAKRNAILKRLDDGGYAHEPCGPPPSSGWMSYLGDVALDVPYWPSEPRYEGAAGDVRGSGW